MAFPSKTFIFAAIILSLPAVEAKVVALLSVPHIANVRTHTNVGRALTAMGHEAYVLIPQFMLDEKTVIVEGIKVIAYGDYLGNVEENLTQKILHNFWKTGYSSPSDIMFLLKTIQDMIPQILSDKLLLKTLQGIKPDLFVLSKAPPFNNMVILPYMMNSSFAYLSPYNDLYGNRVPISFSAVPCQAFSFDTQTFINRLKNAVCHSVLMALDYFFQNDNMVKEFAPHRPPISVNELSNQAEVYLLESDHILDYAKPHLPNIKVIGGTAATSIRPLKDPFKKFIDGSKNGIAVVTFGSSVVNIPGEVMKMMSEAFEQQDLDVVWRVNYTSSNPNKILTSTWLPQNDILAHSNTKLFVSHCGANGQYEALYHSVPLLCLPLFGDQLYNAHRTTVKGFGLKADITKISSEQLASLMKEVSENTKYSSNIKKASKIFKELFREPDKAAAFWIDHVMTHGGSYMRSAGLDMPLYQFWMLDIIGFVLFVIIIIVMVLFSIFCFCCRVWSKCFKQHQTLKKKKND